MKVIIDTKENILNIVANEIINEVNNNPNLVLGLATGSTPLGIYERLVDAFQNKKVSFKSVITFNLDEYVGLNENHPESYRYYMNKNLFDKTDFTLANTHVPTEETYLSYDKMIEMTGGINLQILGIGSNGHIAFNEPGSDPSSLTRIVNLRSSTIKDNARFFSSVNEVPTQAMTMGIASILKVKKIILMAFGIKKAEAIRKMIKEPVNTDLPASYLQNHSNVIIYCDKEAASLL